MNKFIKFIVVLALAISLPLEGFAAVLPACALMNHSNSNMMMQVQDTSTQQTTMQVDTSKSKPQNCNCDYKQMADGKACGQSVACSTCVFPPVTMFYHAFVVLATTDIFLSGPQVHGPPLITSSLFRPPIIASA